MEVCRKQSSEAVDIQEVDSAWLGVVIDQDMHHEEDVGSTENTDGAEECALGLVDRQVDHNHMADGYYTVQVGVAHVYSRESSSVLE